MKTVKGLKFRKLGKSLALTLVTASLVVSCGKDANKTNSSDTYVGSNPVFQSSPTDLSHWNAIKNKFACNPQVSSGRLPDLVFTVQGGSQGGYYGGYGNTVSGQLVPGGASGSIQGSYAGVNVGTRDAVYITKMANGSQVVYNVVVSLCSYGNFIGGNGQLSNFTITTPIVLNSSSNCPIGNVSIGEIGFTSSTYTYGPIYAGFTSNSCLLQ